MEDKGEEKPNEKCTPNKIAQCILPTMLESLQFILQTVLDHEDLQLSGKLARARSITYTDCHLPGYYLWEDSVF